MGKFTRIPQNTFQGLQLDAGVLLYHFDPEHPDVKEEDIICPTTGGINATCKPTYSDFGEDVDNCPTNTMELKHLDGWNCGLSFTSLGTTPESIRLALGAADLVGKTKIVPRRDLKQSDFRDVWWVGDRADGGMVATRLINALSTAGLSLQTTKNGKGQVSVELTGHVSIDAQEVMPMEFYSAAPTAVASIPNQDHTMLGKQVSEFVTPDTTVSNDGVVKGTLKHVTGFTAFNEGNPGEQEGNYFPFLLNTTGTKMTIKKNGTAAPDKTNMAFDPEILLRVGSKSDTFSVEVDGKPYISLDFSAATLLSE